MNGSSSHKPSKSRQPSAVRRQQDTIGSWLRAATQALEAAGIGTARLDTLVLLGDATGHDRGWLLAHADEILSAEYIKALHEQLKRRAAHEPLAYIREKVEFYGRGFFVDARVLVPRPESETMIELLKQLAPPIIAANSGHATSIVDVGTGSGALAVTAALEVPGTCVYGFDIDPRTLEVAARNAAVHGVDVSFAEHDLVAGVSHDIILANLPYVPDGHGINQAAMQEPRHAIFGGADGLDLYRRMFIQLDELEAVKRPKLILTESLPPQHPALAALAADHGYAQTTEDDFIQAFTPKAYSRAIGTLSQVEA